MKEGNLNATEGRQETTDTHSAGKYAKQATTAKPTGSLKS